MKYVKVKPGPRAFESAKNYKLTDFYNKKFFEIELSKDKIDKIFRVPLTEFFKSHIENGTLEIVEQTEMRFTSTAAENVHHRRRREASQIC